MTTQGNKDAKGGTKGPKFDLMNIIEKEVKEAEKSTIVVTQEKSGDLITDHDANAVLEKLAKNKGIPLGAAAISLFELALAGGLNAGAPANQKVEIAVEKNFLEVTKGDLEHAYTSVINNKYLRRLAEKFATQISEYAERKGKQGDLAEKIKRSMSPEDIEFSPAELAWLSSFNQKNQDCRNRYPRVSKALDKDYNNRFRKTQKKPKGKK
jgi:hypothetical protein